MKKKYSQNIVIGLLTIVLALTVFQSYQINSLSSDIQTTGSTNKNSGTTLNEIVQEITPTGTPDYGKKAGVSYEKVEEGLETLANFHSSISLSDKNKQKYINIATTKGTACEFCCGIGNNGFGTKDGRLACGCSHNVAFSGLTKWLLENTDYNDEKIISEIEKWKVLFFPQGSVEKELEKRNIDPTTVGLPDMRGGC